MTYGEAIAQGYTIFETRYQRGYTSRKIDLNEREVRTAGGRRKGQLYFLYPCPWSTQYCYRVYLTK